MEQSGIFADDSLEDDYTQEEIHTIQAEAQVTEEPKINSRAAIVLDRNSKKPIYEKNINDRRPMASTTKIMTGILIIENCDLNEEVTISKKAAGTGGSTIDLKTGDKVKVRDLLYGLMLRSGNDAAVALAEHLDGSVEQFSERMNKKARDLGLYNTSFVSPHGLDNENHYTTAYELALLTDYALNNETFCKVVSTKTCTIAINGNSRSITNTNELLGNLYGVNGVKTGYTGLAGRCLVTSVKRDNFSIITIVLGADTKKQRTRR